jgi:hypothetical protein
MRLITAILSVLVVPLCFASRSHPTHSRGHLPVSDSSVSGQSSSQVLHELVSQTVANSQNPDDSAHNHTHDYSSDSELSSVDFDGNQDASQYCSSQPFNSAIAFSRMGGDAGATERSDAGKHHGILKRKSRSAHNCEPESCNHGRVKEAVHTKGDSLPSCDNQFEMRKKKKH